MNSQHAKRNVDSKRLPIGRGRLDPVLRRSRRLRGLAVLLAVSTHLAVFHTPYPAAAVDAGPESDERIASLIEDLGHAQFPIREQAQAELQRIGLAAFDALNDAVESDQLEIALRAQYLLRSMRVEWYEEDDPKPLKQLLTDYGSQSPKERLSRIERLAKLDEGNVLRALCRLARFETNAHLSKVAALNAMQLELENRIGAVATIRKQLGVSQRPGANWLSLFAEQLEDGAAVLGKWNDVIRKERQLLVTAANRTSLRLVRDLSRWHVAKLEEADRQADATEAIRRSLELIDGSKEQVKENARWLMKKEAWSLVRDLAERHADFFENRVDFKYLLAEAELGAGQQAEANQYAKEALALHAGNHEEHIEAAVQLVDNGLFDWAASEFKARMEQNAEDSLYHIRSRLLYSEMLYDGLLKPGEAADVLEPAIAKLSRPNLPVQVRALRSASSVTARVNYFRALALVEEKKYKEARALLEKALGINGDRDPDVIIAMYRLPDQDAAFKRRISAQIASSARTIKTRITQYRNLYNRNGQGQIRQQYARTLSTLNNQYAWLVSNTEGDYQDAVRASRESLELTPGNPMYLDTLARCYYAAGDLRNAIKHQRLAVDQMPHSAIMQRQLGQFEAELKQQDGK